MVLVRKLTKDYGTSKRIEGRFEAGETVALVEDIVTSGGAAIQAAEALREAGASWRTCTVWSTARRGAEAAAAAGLMLAPALHLVGAGNSRSCLKWRFFAL